MSEINSGLLQAFAASGFTFHEVLEPRGDLTPFLVARRLSRLTSQDGLQETLIEHETPDLTAAINRAWEELATAGGLFTTTSADGRREFLIGLDMDFDPSAQGEPEDEFEEESGDESVPRYRWVRAALTDHWDIAGAGCESGLLGAGRGNPTFTMSSLTGDTMMIASYWQSGIGIELVKHPERIATLRESAEQIAADDSVESRQREWAELWLEQSGG